MADSLPLVEAGHVCYNGRRQNSTPEKHPCPSSPRHELSKHFGAQDVFQGVSAAVARGDKIALVGPNGAGKTTLLRILLGMEEPTAGNVATSRGLRMGYLPQRPTFHSEQTVYEEMLSSVRPCARSSRRCMAWPSSMAASPIRRS